MTRKTVILLLAAVALLLAAVPLRAPAHAATSVDPATIDPAALRLPDSALPPGASIDHSAVSDNADASAQTTPADGFKSQLAILHQTLYAKLGRLTGYRMDFRYTLGGAPAGTEYLVSVFPTADNARAAMADAIGPGSLIQIIGAPLPRQCTVGDACAAYSGPVPGQPLKAVVAIYTDGPILVETATQVPAASFAALEPQLESVLFGFLATSDALIKTVLGGQTSASSTPTATATATATPTVTPSPTPQPTKARHKKRKCKKGYKRVHGKCKRQKRVA